MKNLQFNPYQRGAERGWSEAGWVGLKNLNPSPPRPVVRG